MNPEQAAVITAPQWERSRELLGMPARDFTLHREPMLLLEKLIDIGPGYGCCSWQPGDSLFLVPDKGVPAYVGIEAMAQCVAVYAGAMARLRGERPAAGFLLGARQFQATLAYFDPGAFYEAACRELVRHAQGMASFSCEIRRAGERVAAAKLAVLQPEPRNSAANA